MPNAKITTVKKEVVTKTSALASIIDFSDPTGDNDFSDLELNEENLQLS